MNDTTQQPEADDSGPIPKVSQGTGIPLRTLYNWIAAGKVKTRTVDGQQVVSRGAVLALAATRDASGDLGGAGSRAGTGASTGTPVALASPPGGSQVDGQVAAAVFSAFGAGNAPIDVVQEMELPPKLVLDLHRQYEELTSAAGPKGPTTAERLDDLAARLAQLEGAFMRVDCDAKANRSDLTQVAAHLQSLPIPARSMFTCAGCGATGWVETLVRCTACGTQTSFGFQPPKP